MEDEMRNFINSWLIIIPCLSYCYFISSKLPKGKFRLVSILPIIFIFSFIPLMYNSFALQFYLGPCVGWLANFKLLLFAFGKDDHLSTNPSTSLLHFILAIIFPIKIVHKSTPPQRTKTDFILYLTFVINALIWSIMVQIYVNFRHHLLFKNPLVVHVLYSGRMLFGTQVFFALYAAVAYLLLGKEIELQFDNPHLSTSLQNFWGRRWNQMVSNLLKSTIHEPVKSFFMPMLGKRWAMHPAILITYLVSGLMHEVMHFYVGRQWPTWEVTWFFVIHGIGLAIEVEVKKCASKKGWKLHPFISIPLTVGFVMGTGIWLCYAELIHYGSDVREVEEYMAFVDYVKHHVA